MISQNEVLVENGSHKIAIPNLAQKGSPKIVTPKNPKDPIFTAEEEALLEVVNKKWPGALPSEIELVKLGSTLKKDRIHILNWFKQRRVKKRSRNDPNVSP